LIQKWLKVGVLEEGVVIPGEKGTGQGSVISPLLADATLLVIKEELWRRMHWPLPIRGNGWGRVVSSYLNYHAVPTIVHSCGSETGLPAAGKGCLVAAVRRAGSTGLGYWR
jgi:hypothetical protein